MNRWPEIVEEFPLTVGKVFQQYTRMPPDVSTIYYHYTSHAGLEGILRSGGLRATYRMRMNDSGEFDYARNIVYAALDEVGRRHDLPSVVQSLTTYTRKNLDLILENTVEMSRAYCACLSISSDHPEQWKTYAEEGLGFAIGINLLEFLNSQRSVVQKREPYIFCAPVTYDETVQCDLVWRFVEAGIHDLKTFRDTCSQQSEDLTALRNRITMEIVVHLFTLIDFIKAPTYSSEREFRLFLDPNDDTLEAPNIQHYERNNEPIPFIFMNLCSPKTGRLFLAEIKIGPKASFLEEKVFLEGLLDELGYGSNHRDKPRITHSLVKTG